MSNLNSENNVTIIITIEIMYIKFAMNRITFVKVRKHLL